MRARDDVLLSAPAKHPSIAPGVFGEQDLEEARMRSTARAMHRTIETGRIDRLETAMHTMRATEAKARLVEILRTVERGKTVAITRHGKAIAHVIPARAGERADRKKLVDRFRHRRDRWQPIAMSIDDILISRHAGHRL